jgi:hypothetical protein
MNCIIKWLPVCVLFVSVFTDSNVQLNIVTGCFRTNVSLKVQVLLQEYKMYLKMKSGTYLKFLTDQPEQDVKKTGSYSYLYLSQKAIFGDTASRYRTSKVLSYISHQYYNIYYIYKLCTHHNKWSVYL